MHTRNCFIVFSMPGMFFGVLMKNCWEERLRTKPTDDRRRMTEPREGNPVCAAHSWVLREGERRGTILPLKAGRPGWATKAKRVKHAINVSDLMVGAILE
jgi:hypothetical protein